MSWPAVIVLAVVASCAVVLVARYFLVNRKTQAAASAARPDPPVTLSQPDVHPELDEALTQTDSWIWR
jgi:flagellar basal body-associated protein FliL